MIQMLKPLAEPREHYPMGKILSYCAGNHDEGRYKDTGISAAESIAVGLGLEDRYSTDGCFSFIKIKTKQHEGRVSVCTVYNTHLTGGGVTAGAKANKIQRISMGIVADVYVGSHFHSPMTYKEDIIIPGYEKCSLTQKTMTYVITNAFLRYGDYAQRAGMKPSSISIPKIFISQRRDIKGGRFVNAEVRL